MLVHYVGVTPVQAVFQSHNILACLTNVATREVVLQAMMEVQGVKMLTVFANAQMIVIAASRKTFAMFMNVLGLVSKDTLNALTITAVQSILVRRRKVAFMKQSVLRLLTVSMIPGAWEIPSLRVPPMIPLIVPAALCAHH